MTLTTVIPTHNGERHLAEALDSIASQSRGPDRVVVMDDGSTDGTIRIAHERIKCEVVHNKNVGSLMNHNRGLRYAQQADLLHFMHQDDVIGLRFYEAAENALASRPGRSLAHCVPDAVQTVDYNLLNDRGWHWRTWRYQSDRSFTWDRCKLGVINPTSVVLKTDRKEPACYFTEEFPVVGDQVFMARWASNCNGTVKLHDGLCQYRANPLGDTARIVARDTQAWVRDELPAMLLMSELLGPEWRRARGSFLKALFVARSAVKSWSGQARARDVWFHAAAALLNEL